MAQARKVELPLSDRILRELRAGDNLLLTGTMCAARDVAHKRIVEALQQGKSLPFDIKGAAIYYMGPSPARPGRLIGSAGPTTSARMDTYTPCLIAAGLKAMIGKGPRAKEVKDALVQHGAVYLGAVGGAGALLSQSIKKSVVVAYDELGPEAIRLLEVEDFPVTVINDIYGGDLYEEGKARYRIKP